MPYINEYSQLNPKEQRQLFYKRLYKEGCPDWDDSMIILKNWVQNIPEDNLITLDFGCGHGNFVIDELPHKFGERVGIDVDVAATEGNKSVEKVAVFDGSNFPLPNNYFDLVVSLWVFEHVKEPETVLREINRVLKPGGRFIFVTPNKNSALILIRRLMNKRLADFLLKIIYGREEDDVFAVYYRLNTLSDVRKIAESAGFEVINCKTNPDPSYTSFNKATYYLSKILSMLPGSLFRPHIVAALKKPAEGR